MIVHLLIFLVSLVLLAKGADFFVEYAARLAGRFGVSEFVIGLTLTSIGTSIPELAAAVSASLEEAPGLVIGNVVGSNIANIGLILGVAALMSNFATDKKMFLRDGYIMLASVILFFAFALDNNITRWEAIVLLVMYVAYLFFLIRSDDEEEGRYHFHHFIEYVFDYRHLTTVKDLFVRDAKTKEQETGDLSEEREPGTFTLSFFKELGIVIASGLAIMVGAHYLVEEAVWLAEKLSVPQSVIGLSIVAVGTSLPELTVSIAAARKGKGGLVVGNVVGSNIANILLILGVSGIIFPLPVAEISVVYTIPVMLFFSIALLYFIRTNWHIGTKKGIIVITAYGLFMALAFLKGWG